MDGFHDKYIPFEHILNAIEALGEARVKVVVLSARIKNDNRTIKLIKCVEKLGVKVLQQPVIPFSGRSLTIPPEKLYKLSLKDMRYYGCVSILSPTVGPDNYFYACCASDFKNLECGELCLGDLGDIELDLVIRQNAKNNVLDALYLWGAKALYDILIEEGFNVSELFKESYCGYCELCYMIMKNSEAVELLRSVLRDQKWQCKIIKHKAYRRKEMLEKPIGNCNWFEFLIKQECL